MSSERHIRRRLASPWASPLTIASVLTQLGVIAPLNAQPPADRNRVEVASSSAGGAPAPEPTTVAKPGASSAPTPIQADAWLARVLDDPYHQLIVQALEEFQRGNWQGARVLFRRAHDLEPSARTLRGIGIVSYEMGDYAQAVLALSAALADTRRPLTEPLRRECELLLDRARVQAAVQPVAALGRRSIMSP